MNFATFCLKMSYEHVLQNIKKNKLNVTKMTIFVKDEDNKIIEKEGKIVEHWKQGHSPAQCFLVKLSLLVKHG